MSDVLDRIRRELQQRLESTREAAQEHQRVRAALEALEHAVAPREKAARRAAGGATQDRRGSTGRGRPLDSQDGAVATGSPVSPAGPGRGPRRRRPPARAGKPATASTAKCPTAVKARSA